MTKKLSWRLSKLPTPDEVRELVKDKIITQDEAREILFSETDEVEKTKESLEAEIKFLRELVEKLSQSPVQIVKVVETVQVPIYIRQQPWYRPYEVWCSNVQTYTSSNSMPLTGVSFSNLTC